VFRDVANANASDGEHTKMPLDTPIPVPVSDAPAVGIMNCEEVCFAKDGELDCPESMDELPLDGAFTCYPGEALWSRTRCEDCFCFTAVCLYEEPCPG
jgi:hypothetical protein